MIPNSKHLTKKLPFEYVVSEIFHYLFVTTPVVLMYMRCIHYGEKCNILVGFEVLFGTKNN